MRKPKGKLVALLAGAVVVAVTAMFWKDVYCHVFLDPELVGRWSETRAVRDIGGLELKFDKVERERIVSTEIRSSGRQKTARSG